MGKQKGIESIQMEYLPVQPKHTNKNDNRVIGFQGDYRTDAGGFHRLNTLFASISKIHDEKILFDWKQLGYMDANLSALLLCLIQKLTKNNNLSFLLDEQSLVGGHNVFSRNGFADLVHNTGCLPLDERESTITVKKIFTSDADAFVNYIDEKFLGHRALANIQSEVKNRIADSYNEVFGNVEIHAETDHVFVCGQYFPTFRELKFTLVDSGCGFLSKISTHTAGSSNITSIRSAIEWAIQGGSTKTQAAGGSGLRRILSYCIEKKGSIHISSDGGYWIYDPLRSNKPLFHSVTNFGAGTTINLIFRFT
ncbi:hypothetical protein GO730_26595 [Spirosoma sp. HMF3257]|uniref:Uncharacterized protein n=1 Tax=Spirosoma telluris TaxID=2183553 RepID=A0A327NVH4_9BACT|nr:hypothetical protein [Spirosoma telluris]RAI76838.1 hypothetical protein HMF3257_26525 [Spirosoma telluris]